MSTNALLRTDAHWYSVSGEDVGQIAAVSPGGAIVLRRDPDNRLKNQPTVLNVHHVDMEGERKEGGDVGGKR